MSEATSRNNEERYYLECPFGEKDDAKKLGAKWDPEAKKWYYTDPDQKEIFQRWLPDNFRVYEIPRTCYKCNRKNEMLTYIKFDDDSNEDVVFPWNKERLLDNQDTFAHMKDPSIEYYGLKVLGEDDKLDKVMLEKYPKRIEMRYSSTLKKKYAANICQHCGAMLGWNELYRIVNDRIKKNEELTVYNK